MSFISKKSNVELFKDIYNDPDSKSLYKIFSEFILLAFYNKELPRHYFSKFLFKKDITNIKDYFSNKFLDANIKTYFNDYSVSEILENKLFFDLFYSQFSFNLPKNLMYNHENVFVINNERIETKSLIDFKNLLKIVFNNNPELNSIIIKKTYSSYGGDKIFKLTRSQFFKEDSDKIISLYKNVLKAGFLFQTTIIQHKNLDKLNPSCLNTLRFDTFIDNTGKIDIISGYLRMSINNSYVDNASQGGCFVGVDILNGKLKKKGFLKFTHSGTRLLSFHPITKVVFENFQIPYFEKAKEMVLNAASYLPGLRLVGWDIGITESGPILVEGNSWYNAHGNDLTVEGYGSNPIFNKVLLEFQEKRQ